jgi:galactosyl transferase GMA12/MNN10 family
VSDRVIVSLGTGPQESLLRLARRSFTPYARRHGYDLDLHTEIVDGARPAPWSKIPLLRDLVLRYETVVWLDADTVIVDRSVDIADEVVREAFLYLVEHTVRGEPRPNTGVMLLRGGEEAASFLDEVWALKSYVHHRWWENAAVCELLGYSVDPPARLRATRLRERTRFISPRWNWTTDAPVRGARIRHFPGFAPRTRRLMMLAALAEAEARAVVSRA